MTSKNNRASLLSNIKLCASFHHHLWIQTGVTVKLGCDLCDLDLWPLTLNFCMDIISVIGNNSRKFHDDTMTGTWWKRCHSQTDRQTDRRTDRAIHRAAWSQLKIGHVRNKCKFRDMAILDHYVFQLKYPQGIFKIFKSVFTTPCLYHELNMIIHTSYINI